MTPAAATIPAARNTALTLRALFFLENELLTDPPTDSRLPTPGNSNSRSFSNSQFRGVRTRMAHKHAASQRPRKAHAYRHQKYWDETNKYFYIHQIRCQAEPTAGQPHRSEE